MTILSPDQQNAADKFMEFLLDDCSTEMAIEGHAGTGKSYLTSYLINAARNAYKMLNMLTDRNNDVRILLTATTNKAAKVLSEMTNEEATTIHSLLKLKVYNNTDTGKTGLRRGKDCEIIGNTLIIVDEASMINEDLLELIRESTHKCKVVYILDSYQLAPIKEAKCPVSILVENKVRLTTIQRQAQGSPIVSIAEGFRKVLDGQPFPTIKTAAPEVLRVDGPEFKKMITKEFSALGHNPDDAKILAWTNAKVHAYNKFVRGLYTNSEEFLAGEYVMTNNPILGYKGKPNIPTDSIVHITDIDPDIQMRHGVKSWYIALDDRGGYLPVNPADYKAKLKELAVIAKKAKDWSEYFLVKDGFLDLRTVHASTVHKSQGSTHDRVFIDLADIGKNHVPHEVARLLYVAITRAAKQVIVYGKLPYRYGDS